MKNLVKSFIASCKELGDLIMGIIMFKAYCDPWYPRDVLYVELRVFEEAYKADLLGIFGLLCCITLWHYFRVYVAEYIATKVIDAMERKEEKNHRYENYYFVVDVDEAE